MNIELEIRKAVKAKKIVFGKKQTDDSLKTGKVKLVVLPENSFYKDMIENYAKLSDTQIVNFKGDSFKLGTACERQHAISVLAILK